YGSRPTDPTGLVAGPSFTGGDLYSYLNLITSTPASMNFVNMSGGESLAGLTTPTSFSIYEFIVTVPTAAVGATLNLPAQFNIPLLLQLGDYVAGWDLASNNHFYATPFTTAGLVTTTSSTSSSGISSTGSTSSTSSSSGISSTGVPEPNSSSLALLGLGLLAASFWVRRRTQL
ncbi:MAG TPA: PEP-CTERM sorting domain-containing protein, partial [Methylibium sp.]